MEDATTIAPRGAALALEANPNLFQLRVAGLTAEPFPSSEEDGGGGGGGSGRSYPHVRDVLRFVAALERHRKVRVATFVSCRFGKVEEEEENHDGDFDGDGHRRGPRHELPFERLFGSVLPRHPSLDQVTFSRCTIPPRYLRMLLLRADGPAPLSPCSSSSSSSLRRLCLYDCELLQPDDAARVLADALGRRSSSGSRSIAQHLEHVSLLRCGLTSEGCRLVLDGAAQHAHPSLLRSLAIDASDRLVVDASTLARLLGNNERSQLRTLRVVAREWTREGIEALARMLRTNCALESLDVSGANNGPVLDLTQIRTLLSTYNFTLRYLPGPVPEEKQQRDEITRLLDRNLRVCQDYDRLLQDQVPRISVGSCRPLWAESIGRVSRFPTLVYRLLRQGGNAVGLAEFCLQQHQQRRSHTGRLKRKLGSDSAAAKDDDGGAKRRRRSSVTPPPAI